MTVIGLLDFFKTTYIYKNFVVWIFENIYRVTQDDFLAGIYLSYRVTSYTMAMCFWYPVKHNLSSVCYCTVVCTSVTFYKIPEQHGHVYFVGLYLHDICLLWCNHFLETSSHKVLH